MIDYEKIQSELTSLAREEMKLKYRSPESDQPLGNLINFLSDQVHNLNDEFPKKCINILNDIIEREKIDLSNESDKALFLEKMKPTLASLLQEYITA